jgi:anti-anti-sigma factor
MTKVLVIDDEKGTLSMFRLFLGALGYEVLLAENGAKGLESVKAERPPIVFTDIKMPGMDGFEVLRQIKKEIPETEVIVMTGHGDMDLAVEALNMHATDFINKPIQRTALESALKRAEERLKVSATRKDQVRIRMTEGIAVIDISGNVGSQTEQILMKTYNDACRENAQAILLRFEETCSVNGAGIGVLIHILTQTKKRGQTVGISGISENFEKIFDMVGITRFAKIYDSETHALTAMGKTP